MSVHKVPDSKGGGWEVRWRQAGRQRSKTIHDEDQAHIFDADVRRRRRLGTLADLDAGTELLRDWAVEWRFKSAENRLARSTLDRYDQVWDVHVLPRLGDYQLRQLTAGLIEDDLVAAMEEARAGRATQRKALYLLQAILRYAVRRERIPYNPTEHVERPRQRTRAVRPIPLAAIERMLAGLEPRDRMLVELLGYQGLRPGEALALADDDVRERTLLIESAISVGEEKDTKTHKSRAVRLLPPVASRLAAYQLATRKERLAGGTRLLFPRPDGKPWLRTDYANWRRRTFRPAAKAAGLPVPPTRPYDLRHTFVSMLIQEGRTLAYVADQAGNSVEECARTYTHLFEEYHDAHPVPADGLILHTRAKATSPRRAG